MSIGSNNDNVRAVYSFLPSAESGDSLSQNNLCQLFYNHPELVGTLPDDFWERMDALAQRDEDYANFIMHCRYFEEPAQSCLSYKYLRKAIRKAQVPLAFLRLGITYSKGIGTKPNHALAGYFYEKALTMGVTEAESLIDKEYDNGTKDISAEIENALKFGDDIAPETKDRYRKRLERERLKKNYGYLSRLRNHLNQFYPDYSQEKAIADILEDFHTTDADIFYSTCTTNNYAEINSDLEESLLHQLYAPIAKDNAMRQLFKEYNTRVLRDEEHALCKCYNNFISVYDNLSKDNRVKKVKISAESIELFPYVNVPALSLWRRHALRCILSLKDVHPVIKDHYLANLDNDERLLDICEGVSHQDLQLLLILFVELNINLDVLEKANLSILNSFMKNDRRSLANCLNLFADRLNEACIDHQLPIFTADTLPQITLN